MYKFTTIPKWICRLYLRELSGCWKLASYNIPQLKDGDVGNIYYESKRSLFTYIYLRTWLTFLLDRYIMFSLFRATSIKFNGSLNKYCSPINVYDHPGSYITPHRDRDMITGKPVKYIATIILTAPEKGGEFFCNGFVYNIDKDGKNPQYLHIHDHDFQLMQGEVIVLDNTKSIHGTRPLVEGKRISLTFRSN